MKQGLREEVGIQWTVRNNCKTKLASCIYNYHSMVKTINERANKQYFGFKIREVGTGRIYKIKITLASIRVPCVLRQVIVYKCEVSLVY